MARRLPRSRPMISLLEFVEYKFASLACSWIGQPAAIIVHLPIYLKEAPDTFPVGLSVYKAASFFAFDSSMVAPSEPCRRACSLTATSSGLRGLLEQTARALIRFRSPLNPHLRSWEQSSCTEPES